MKIFLSWSGSLSRQLAEITNDFLTSTVQLLEPFVSFEIEKGGDWSKAITENLGACKMGVLVVTPSNLSSTWLHYEAGAIANQVNKNDGVSGRVYALLFNLTPSEVSLPLSRFQLTVFEKEDVYKMLVSLNKYTDRPLEETRLAKIFNNNWESYVKDCQSVISEFSTSEESVTQKREEREMLAEILDIVRTNRVESVESSSKKAVVLDDTTLKIVINHFGERTLSKLGVFDVELESPVKAKTGEFILNVDMSSLETFALFCDAFDSLVAKYIVHSNIQAFRVKLLANGKSLQQMQFEAYADNDLSDPFAE